MITSWPEKVFTCNKKPEKQQSKQTHKIIHMSSQLTSQGMVLATTAAMVVSGMVILLALRLHNKTLPADSQFHPSPQVLLRSCISSSDERRRNRGDESSTNKSKKKKRVRFTDDVVADPGIVINHNNDKGPCSCPNSSKTTTNEKKNNNGDKARGMPANRMALYNGILRDRVAQRMAYSH